MLKAVKTLIGNVFTESKSAPLPVTLPPQVDTLKKAQSFYDSLQVTKQNIERVPGNQARRELIEKQISAANEALAYHQTSAKVDAIPLKFEIDSKQTKEAVESTKAIVAIAEKTLQAASKKHDDLTRRLAPLTEKLNAEAAQAEERLKDAQKLFDAAMASGNEADEAAAAEALALAKSNGQTQTLTDSPIEIRVTALTKELANSQIQLDDAKKALACAIDEFLMAKANLSKFQYDQKVFDLACFAAGHEEEFKGVQSEKQLRMDIYGSFLKINSPDRFSYYVDGSSVNLDRFASNMSKPSAKKIIQNFELYAKNIDDVPELIQEQGLPTTLEEVRRREAMAARPFAMAGVTTN